jgi:hypothetical protein
MVQEEFDYEFRDKHVKVIVVLHERDDNNERWYIEDAIRALIMYKNTLPEGQTPHFVKEITVE